MGEFKLSPQSLSDIEEIWDYIANDNLDAADRVRDEIFSLVLATNLRICREWGICARTWLQELAPIGLVKAVEGRDVRVVQRGEKVGLMLEPRDLRRIELRLLSEGESPSQTCFPLS